MRKGMLGAALALCLAAGGLRAGTTEDDLAVVKKALESVPQAATASVAAAETPKAVAPARKGAKPQWLKVRVSDKGSKKAKVSINVPLALVEALGDEPLDLCHRDDRPHCHIKLKDVLTSLEAGQEILEVDDEEATVRVWVE